MTDEQVKIIVDAKINYHLLGQWEKDFVDNLARRPAFYELSGKQNSILNRISRKLQWD